MDRFEYKVVPAPAQGRKAKGVKGTPERFALALEDLMNALGAEGWDYVRADTLPCEERAGFTGRTTTYQNMLVFRRARAVAEEDAPSVAVAGLLTAPLPEAAGADAPDRGPAPIAGPPDAGDPPLTRSGGAEPQASEAARAAAAAFRLRRPEGDRGADKPGGSGVAAE